MGFLNEYIEPNMGGQNRTATQDFQREYAAVPWPGSFVTPISEHCNAAPRISDRESDLAIPHFKVEYPPCAEGPVASCMAEKV
jgi:hypothetical protein